MDAEVVAGEIQGELAAWPTGETSPGPCQAVRTPNHSHSAASLRAGLRPPICEMWTRMKSISRSVISGRYSCGVLNSSPIAIGVLVCWRRMPEVAVLLGRERVLEEEQAVLLELLAQLDRLVGRDALVDVVQQLDLVAELAAHVLEQLGDVRT